MIVKKFMIYENRTHAFDSRIIQENFISMLVAILVHFKPSQKSYFTNRIIPLD